MGLRSSLFCTVGETWQDLSSSLFSLNSLMASVIQYIRNGWQESVFYHCLGKISATRHKGADCPNPIKGMAEKMNVKKGISYVQI